MAAVQRSAGRWALGVLLALCGVAVAFAETGESDEPLARPGMVVGVVANTLDGGRQDDVRRAGIRWLREELRWQDLEPQRGRFDWRTSDALFRSTATRQLHVLPLLLGTPRWLGRPADLPRDPKAFARFAAAAAARYGRGGTFWRKNPRLDARLAPTWFEVWNEPWFRAFSRSGVDPAAFATLARGAMVAGRRANPRTKWLLPVEAEYVRDDGSEGDWVDDLAAAAPDLGRVADGFSVHPYDEDDPRTDRGSRRLAFARMDDVRADLRERGWRTRPLWITEVGWTTCSLRPGCVSERLQRRYLTALFELVRAQPDVAAVFTYAMFDPGTAKPRVPAFYYGLVRHDGKAKPALAVVRRAARDAAR